MVDIKPSKIVLHFYCMIKEELQLPNLKACYNIIEQNTVLIFLCIGMTRRIIFLFSIHLVDQIWRIRNKELHRQQRVSLDDEVLALRNRCGEFKNAQSFGSVHGSVGMLLQGFKTYAYFSLL